MSCEQNVFSAPRQRIGVVKSRELNVNYINRFARVSTVSLFSPLIFRLHGIAALTQANFLRRVGHHEKRNVLAQRSFHHIHRSLIAYYISFTVFAAFGTCKCKSSLGHKSKNCSQKFSLGNALSSFEGEHKAPILKVSNFKDRRILWSRFVVK